MLGLPASTTLSKQLPKKAFYEKFEVTASDRVKIDAVIAKLTIIHEVSPASSTLPAGEEVKCFHVLQVTLKTKTFDERILTKVLKWMPSHVVFLLEYQGEYALAVYHTKLFCTAWSQETALFLPLTGLDLDAVWKNIILHIGGIVLEAGRTIEEQIEVNTARARILHQIEQLDRQARKEIQPKRKFELVQEINALRKELM